MEGITFLNDDDIKTLFSDNNDGAETEDDSNEFAEKSISDDDVASMFAENSNDESQTGNAKAEDVDTDEDDKTDDNVDDSEGAEEEKLTKQPSEKTNQSDNGSSVDFLSVAKEFAKDGLFGDIDENELNEVRDADSFKKLIKSAIDKGLDEDTRRVKEALELGLETKDIVEFEDTIKFLHSITKRDLLKEDDEGEGDMLRKRLILQDFINNGMSEEEAVAKYKELYKNGEDIDAAEKALKANKQFFQDEYDKLFEKKRKEKEEFETGINDQTKKLKDAIFGESKYFGEIELDEKLKKLALKNLSELQFKDKETRQMLTAIQKYERENRTDFLKNIGILFTLTDGFKNIDKLVKKAVNRRVNKQIGDMEEMLRNPSQSDDTLKLARGSNRSNIIENFSFDI